MKQLLCAAAVVVMVAFSGSANAVVINTIDVTNSGRVDPITAPNYSQLQGNLYASTNTELKTGQPSGSQSNNGWGPFGTTDATHSWWNIGDVNSFAGFNVSGNFLSIVWGSPNNINLDQNDGNRVTFWTGASGTGSVIGSISVADLVANFAGIDNTTDPGFLIGFGTQTAFNSVVFSTSPSAFEFAFASPVPEPSTWAMMILGFIGIGFMAYRRRNVAALAA
ncbi:MAG TPA: PEPxxWA-CTERM sorting domain-containing protein [Bradyrhizobium sp.]|nr:PEPxxWA-CTERM sorting domain-containing protein [Bradyrhizobium sp.]